MNDAECLKQIAEYHSLHSEKELLQSLKDGEIATVRVPAYAREIFVAWLREQAQQKNDRAVKTY